jgi:hypothetical protein
MKNIILSPQIYFDTINKENNKLPRNFRDLNLYNLKAIASAQFSENELIFIKKKFFNKKITIVDLRKENHFFINGIPVSIFNENIDLIEIQNIDLFYQNQLTEIKKHSKISIKLENGDYKEILIKKLLSEEELVKSHGFGYKRFPIKDYNFPNKDIFDDIVEFLLNLKSEDLIYVHCAGGKGRSTIFLSIYDIVINSKQTSLAEIFLRQHKIGGANLYNIKEDNEWEESEKKKLKILVQLYSAMSLQ